MTSAATSRVPSSPTQARRPLHRVLTSLAAALCLIALCFVWLTRHWPMVGDAALLHYSVFLIQHGWAPYRGFTDVNLPGAYAATALGMLFPGQPDIGWRLFDIALVGIAGLASYVIARPHSRFAALFATVMLLVVHGQDGVQQAGQRDLVLASLLLAGLAALIASLRREQVHFVFAFGVAIGMGSCIKPTAAPLGLVLLGIAVFARWRGASNSSRSVAAWTISGLAGMVLAPTGMVLWLWRRGALWSWLHLERVLLPYYASLDRKPLLFTLSHSLSPLAALVASWAFAIVVAPPRWTATRSGTVERILVASALVVNLLGLLAQGKALPYQRYPMLVFLLLLSALDLTLSAKRLTAPSGARERIAGGLALLALTASVLVIAPLALLRVSRFEARPQRFDALLSGDLKQVSEASNPGSLNRNVQCMDTIQDCLPTLFALQLQPATGVLSDAELFGRSQQPAVELMRHRFLQEALVRPPRVIVLVSGSFLDSTNGYQKLAAWPEFSSWLRERYRLVVDRPSPGSVRWWSRPQPEPGYRLYVLREPAARPDTAPR